MRPFTKEIKLLHAIGKDRKSQVALLEQKNVLRNQVFVRLPFQCQARAVLFSLTNYEECLHQSE